MFAESLRRGIVCRFCERNRERLGVAALATTRGGLFIITPHAGGSEQEDRVTVAVRDRLGHTFRLLPEDDTDDGILPRLCGSERHV